MAFIQLIKIKNVPFSSITKKALLNFLFVFIVQCLFLESTFRTMEMIFNDAT